MENRRSTKRIRISTEEINADDQVAGSNMGFYFDTLSEEVLSIIINFLGKAHKYELYDYNGVLGDVVRCSFDEADIVLPKYYDLDEQLRWVYYIHVWDRQLILESPETAHSFRYLRSLNLTIQTHISSLDVLFASCGGVLEILALDLYESEGASCNPIFDSISQHCHSLRSLSLVGHDNGPEYLPLLQAVAGNLRRFTFMFIGLQPSKSIWEHFTKLEQLELSSGGDLSFVGNIQSSLQMITLHHSPTIDELHELILLVPDVVLHLKNPISNKHGYMNDVIRVCGKQLRTLTCRGNAELPSDFGNTCSSLVNLECLRLRMRKSSLYFLDTFFVTPKSDLRTLHIRENVSASIFDILATKVSTLEELECHVEVRDNPMNGKELPKFLSANKRLRCLSICYTETEDWSNADIETWYVSFPRNTVLLIRSLKGYTALRQLKIYEPAIIRNKECLLEEISDACVGYRGRGLSIEVNEISYLEKGISAV